MVGSSPRRRGTWFDHVDRGGVVWLIPDAEDHLPNERRDRHSRGLIPARQGSRCSTCNGKGRHGSPPRRQGPPASSSSPATCPVHPCVGGELVGWGCSPAIDVGSSPRRRRMPRYLILVIVVGLLYGSSPRSRGTPGRATGRVAVRPVNPRGGRELTGPLAVPNPAIGVTPALARKGASSEITSDDRFVSSNCPTHPPRGRGALSQDGRSACLGGLIPALAGSTSSSTSCSL